MSGVSAHPFIGCSAAVATGFYLVRPVRKTDRCFASECDAVGLAQGAVGQDCRDCIVVDEQRLEALSLRGEQPEVTSPNRLGHRAVNGAAATVVSSPPPPPPPTYITPSPLQDDLTWTGPPRPAWRSGSPTCADSD